MDSFDLSIVEEAKKQSENLLLTRHLITAL